MDAQTQAFLDKVNAKPPPAPGSVSLEDFRAAIEAFRPLGFECESVADVRDITVPVPEGDEVEARLYLPVVSEGPVPIVVWAHGGSWVRVTVDLLDTYFRFIANRSACAILAVDYGLAPESKFPRALHEIHAAAEWAVANAASFGGDPSRLAVAGESSGGNLAAASALLARERGGPVYAHQLLVVPVLDALFASASWETLGKDYGLTRDQLEWALEQYAPGVERRTPLLSPLYAKDLAQLPPATIVVGELDPLRDEGIEYAKRLADEGVPVALSVVDGLIHHALLVPKAIDAGRTFTAGFAKELGSTLRRGAPVTGGART